MTALTELLKRDRKLPAVLSVPKLKPADKTQIINELLRQAGGGSGSGASTLRNFLETLAENNRLGLLEGVCEKFGKLISVHRGEVEMTVTSAAVRFFFFKHSLSSPLLLISLFARFHFQ
jgi:F-type H+-transporting ATPase subunit O